MLDTRAAVGRDGRVELDKALLQRQQDLNEDRRLEAHKIGGVMAAENVQELVKVFLELWVQLGVLGRSE